MNNCERYIAYLALTAGRATARGQAAAHEGSPLRAERWRAFACDHRRRAYGLVGEYRRGLAPVLPRDILVPLRAFRRAILEIDNTIPPLRSF